MIDIFIPTMKSAEDLAGLVAEVEATAGIPVRVLVTWSSFPRAGRNGWSR
jgi:hypothetical protein